MSSQKARILLKEKNITWQSHHVDLRKHEQVASWFLSINPHGRVPVLVHDGAVHVEVNDILEYVDELRSERASFFPKEPKDRNDVREELAYQASLRLGTRALTIEFMPSKARHLSDRQALQDYRTNGRPDLTRDIEIAWWQKTADHGISRETLIESFASHRQALRRLENRLHNREWLFGKRVSVLDIAWFSTIHRLKVLGYDLSRHPYLLSYYERLLLRQAFREEIQIKGSLKIMVPAYRLYKRMTRSRIEDLVAD